MNKFVQFSLGCSASMGSTLGAMLQRNTVEIQTLSINTILGGLVVVVGFSAVKFISTRIQKI